MINMKISFIRYIKAASRDIIMVDMICQEAYGILTSNEFTVLYENGPSNIIWGNHST